MIYATYVLDRIVETEIPNVLRFIWDDEFELAMDNGWTGWFRGVTGGYDDNGEYERYDTRDGSMRFSDAGTVLSRFIDMGGVLEPYTPEPPLEE